MSRAIQHQLSETVIVRALAEKVSLRLKRKVIADLQKMDAFQADNGFYMQNAWDEICAHFQAGYSLSWKAYDDSTHLLLDAFVEELPDFEREAMWLQTQEGIDWNCEDHSERDRYPVLNSDIVRYLKEEFVYEAARYWNNPRIRAYKNYW